MFTMLALAVVAFVVMALVGLLGSVAALMWWLVLLPFRLLGFVFKGLAVALALPFLGVFAAVGAILFAVGLVIFFLPALPIVLLVAAIWWLAHRRPPFAPHRAN